MSPQNNCIVHKDVISYMLIGVDDLQKLKPNSIANF